MLKKIIIISISFAALALLPSINAFAAATDTYVKTDVPGATEISLSRETYEAAGEIKGSDLGLEESLEGITDLYCSLSGNIYLLLGDNSKLLKINGSLKNAEMVTVTEQSGEEIDFFGAAGIYADSDGRLYIADTGNSRVLITDSGGKLIKKLETPESDLIPDDFLFQPTAVEKDKEGYIYILSRGCYYGALLYTPEYEFMGFYGANTVNASALDTLSYLWKRLTSGDQKKAASVKMLPYSFTDFCLDDEGLMITITGALSSHKYSFTSSVGQLKKISHNGDNILYKRNMDGDSVSSTTVNFLETSKPEGSNVQDFVSVAVNDSGYMFVLDRGNGTVYIYDTECNLISAFGGGYNNGEQLGVFENAVSLTLSGEKIIVADKDDYSLTVFEPTKYGNLLFSAQQKYLNGDYTEARPLWEEVLKLNRNSRLAYRGIAMADYNAGDYKSALENGKLAYDYSVCDLAWQQIVSSFIADNFGIIIIIAVLIIAVIVFLIVFLRKRNKRLIKNGKIRLMLRIPFHPFDSYEDLKYKNQGSFKLAVILTVLFYLSTVMNVIYRGFLYSETLIRNYNALYTLGSTAGLLILWSVCYWLVCSIFSGKGTFGEVYISTSYALFPLIVFRFASVIMTHFVPLSASGLITGIQTVVIILTLFLIAVAMIKVEEYDFFKFLLTGIVTLFFMILVVFILFLCAILISQFADFIITVYEEVAYR